MAVRADEVLRRIDFETKKSEVDELLQKIDTNGSRIHRNNLRRVAHCHNELIIMDLEDAVAQAGGRDSAPDTFVKLLDERYQIRDKRLPLEGVPKPSALENVWSIFRLIAFILWFTLATVTIFYLTPLRWLHPLLRKLGVRNNYLPVDLIQWFYCSGLMAVAGVHCRAEGKELLQALKGSTIVFYTHSSNLDPLLFIAHSPVVTKMIGKLSLFLIPFAGWAARWTFGGLPINRGNRAKAIKSLQRARFSVETWGRSIGISPEGTRSKTGQLLPFKKGPFHLQEETGVPITPALFFGAFELWPRDRIFSATGKTILRFLPPFTPDPKKSRDENIRECRKIFLKALAERLPEDASAPLDTTASMLNVAAVFAVYIYSFSFVKLAIACISLLMAHLQWSIWHFLGSFGLSIIGLSALMIFTD